METKDFAVGALLIGLVFMAGWVGFLYVNPITKTKTKKDEDTEYITKTITEETGLPDDWGLAEMDASFSVYNEAGEEITVNMSDILNGISLYYNQEADPLGREIQEYKYEFMELLSVEDPVSGRTFTGVNILDVLQFANVFFAWNISCKTNNEAIYPNTYLNTTTGDLIINWDSQPTIVAISADGYWLYDLGYGNFSVIRGQSSESIYDLKEIRTLTEWEVDIIVNGTVEYKVNRTNIVDPCNPDGWHYEYHKEVENMGGRMTFNRTYWGTNMSYIINQTIAKDLNYEISAISVDGWGSKVWNNTDVNNGLVYPASYGVVNNSDPQPLPQTDKLMTLIYMEQKFYEYGMFPVDPQWDKGYYRGYAKGPFFLVVPGQTKNKYPGYVKSIEITTYTGPIP